MQIALKMITEFSGHRFLCDCIDMCRTLVPRSACGRRPVCQQRGRSPHTPPPGQEDSPGGTRAPSGSHWDPLQRSGPQQERPDRYLKGQNRHMSWVDGFKREIQPHLKGLS